MTALLEAPAVSTVDTPFDFDELLRQTRPAPRTTLSAAIRTGSAQTLPDRFRWVYEFYDGQMAACAIGAACYAVAGHQATQVHSFDEAAKYFPELNDAIDFSMTELPEFKKWAEGLEPTYVTHQLSFAHTLGALITTLNDIVELTRTRIADIVESLGY
jgi:hypothetical protein